MTTPELQSSVILGLMRIGGLDDEAVRTLVRTARDAGITMFDHADIYGGGHGCERRFGEAGAVPAAERDQVFIQSKVGIRQGFYDSSQAHILSSVDESLDALSTDHLDLLLIHRPDALVEPDEVAAAFAKLKAAGKVRAFGVSNHTPGQIALLQASLDEPLVANQLQFGLGHAALVAQGVAANVGGTDQAYDRDGGVLDYGRLHGIRTQAWSPLADAATGRLIVGDDAESNDLTAAIARIADAHGTTPTVVALAWVLRVPGGTQVVVGTTNADRVVESAAAADLVLSRQEWYELFMAAGHRLP